MYGCTPMTITISCVVSSSADQCGCRQECWNRSDPIPLAQILAASTAGPTETTEMYYLMVLEA